MVFVIMHGNDDYQLAGVLPGPASLAVSNDLYLLLLGNYRAL